MHASRGYDSHSDVYAAGGVSVDSPEEDYGADAEYAIEEADGEDAPSSPPQVDTVASSTQSRPAPTSAPQVSRQQPPAGEHAGERSFVESTQDTLMTFSLDVDTASYTRMRRALHEGHLPEPSLVRPEEYLNFFRYQADQSATRQADAPFAMALEAGPSPFGDRNKRLLRIGVRADSVDQGQRPSANLVFLVDVSGSMNSPDKLGLVKFGLETLVDSLRPDDTVGIVVYAGQVGTLLEPTPVAQRGQLLEAIEGLVAGGSTNGEGGIRAAYDLASQHFRRGGINRVILATDGDFNVGLTGDPLISMIERFRERGIALTALGFGSGNDRNLERLADHGNGAYAFVDSRNEALRVLARDLSGTLQVVAKDVKVQVAMNRAVVQRFRLIGYENRRLAHRDFADDRVDAAEVGSGQFVTALVEYELKPGVSATDAGELAEVRVRYKRPNGSRSMLTTRTVQLREQVRRLADTTETFRFTAAVAELAEVLQHSPNPPRTSLRDVHQLAAEVVEVTPDWNDARDLLGLIERADQLVSH